MFCQTLGGSVFLSFAQTAFNIGLESSLLKHAPSVSAETILIAGATRFREAVGAQNIDGSVLAYNEALQHVFYIAAGAAVGMFFASWGMGWRSVKKVKEERERAKKEKIEEGAVV